jgi:hypothetical protein
MLGVNSQTRPKSVAAGNGLGRSTSKLSCLRLALVNQLSGAIRRRAGTGTAVPSGRPTPEKGMYDELKFS